MTIKKFKEIEFKYSADGVQLEDFIKANDNLDEMYYRLDVSSWDCYYTDKDRTDRFLRHRMGETPELTFKLKIGKTVWEREEVDIRLQKADQEKEIDRFCEFVGYDKNFKIYKSCFIFKYENFNSVYYTVYDVNMKEIGRFMELEFDKNKVEEFGEEGAFDYLRQKEKELFGQEGITYKNRLHKSLFDMYRRK